MSKWLAGSLLVLAGLLGQPEPSAAASPVALPALSVKLDETSISGLSSGAYMAGQFQLAHADIVIGAAIIAGGPYGCAASDIQGWTFGVGSTALNLTQALNVCMYGRMRSFGQPDGRRLAEKARVRISNGDIGPLQSILTDRVYIFSGTEDAVVVPAVVAATASFYAVLGVPRQNIKFVDSIPAGHAFVTLRAKDACAKTAAPYLVNCNYDLAGELLAHIHGPLKAPSRQRQGNFIAFDQKPFSPTGRKSGMADSGIAYVPASCRVGGCRVHVSFHGCRQDLAGVGRAFVENTGFTLWADTNGLVILFPQAGRSEDNPRACWDWWGYTGPDFLTRSAPQIQAVRGMLGQLARQP